MAIPFAITPVNQPGPPVPGRSSGPLSRSVLPMAPSSPGAPPAVDRSPYLSTPTPQFSDSIISLSDLFGYLRKRGWWGVLVGLPLALFAFYMLGMGTPVYEAEAQLLLRIQDTNVFNFNELARSNVTELSAPMLVNNHRTEMKSLSFLDYFYDQFPEKEREEYVRRNASLLSRKDKLLQAIGLYKPGIPGEPRTIFTESIGSAVRVEPLKESHILRIQVRDQSPAMAAAIANHFVQEYIHYVGKQEMSTTENASTYLQKKAEELRTRLQSSEQNLADYRKSESLMQDSEIKDVSGEKVRLFTTAIADAQQRLTKARNDNESIKAAQSGGRSLLEVRIVADNGDVAFNNKQLDGKIAERRSLEATCGRRHPLMVALTNEIEVLRSTLQKSIDHVVAMAEAEVANQERQVSEYQKQLDEARSSALSQSGKNIQQNMLRDQVAMDRELYQKIVLRMNQADLTGQFKDSGALRVADLAKPPEKPVKPNKPVAAIAAIALFGLTFLGIPVAWGIFDDHILKALLGKATSATPVPSQESLTPFFQDPSGAPLPLQAAAAPPLIAQPPAARLPAHSMRMGGGLALNTPGQAPVLARLPIVHPGPAEMMLAQLLQPEPHGALTALHQLTSTLEKQALLRSGLGGVILVTSAEPGEGKTMVAAALAAAFVNQRRSVFMMECNAVSPSLHQWFPQSSSQGSWAHDLESLRYGQTSLFLLPAHDLPAYATSELLDGYREWIDRARAQVDWIILDAAPMLRNFADVAPLAPLATDVIIVNNPGITDPSRLRAAMNLLQPMMSSSALRGLVVNAA